MPCKCGAFLFGKVLFIIFKMGTVEFIFFFIIALYAASLLALIFKKRWDGRFKRILKIINLVSLGCTLLLAILWIFDLHLKSATAEVLPFWIFMSSAVALFGLTTTKALEKIIYGVLFFAHLLLTAILIIPFLGIAITSSIYAPFIPHEVIYENSKIIIADEVAGSMAAAPSPTIYIKGKLFAHKFKTYSEPMYGIDSVSLEPIDESTGINIYHDHGEITHLMLKYDSR